MAIKGSDNTTCYCLQPVVVKKRDDIYEILDGQQRLTTIYLIIHYANEMWIGKQKLSEFQLHYETRDGNTFFLQKQVINEREDKADVNYENNDFYHISKAYNKIHHWVKNFKNNHGNKDFDNIRFLSKLKYFSKFIWYEVATDEDAIEIFTRINMGKSPLSNAESIKALFLNSSNFSDSSLGEIRHRQLEISSEWDRIECSLQNDELWFFINNLGNKLPTRIEYIFDIIFFIAKEECVEKRFRMENRITDEENIKKRVVNGFITINEKYGVDQYSAFRFFSDKLKSKSIDEIDENWKNVKRIFKMIEVWFTERELFQKIG